MDPLAFISLASLLGIGVVLVLTRFGIPEVSAFFASSLILSFILHPSTDTLAPIFSLASILLAFEVGREVATKGFAIEALPILAAEAIVILLVSLFAGLFLGLSQRDAAVMALLFLSSSTPVVVSMSQRLPEDLRRVVLALTALEDSALFILMGAFAGGNPVARILTGIVIAGSSVALLRHFLAIMPRGYQLAASLAVSFGLAALSSILGLSPSLGAFVAGYAYGSVARVSYTTAGELIFMLYAVTAPPMILPLVSGMSMGAPMLLFVGVVSVMAVLLRFLAVFLAALTVTRNIVASAYIGVAMASISELAYMVVAYSNPMGEVALMATLLPIASMFTAPLIVARAAWFVTRMGFDKTMQIVRPIGRDVIDLIAVARIYAAALAPNLSSIPLSNIILAASIFLILLDASHLWRRSGGLAILILASASSLGLFTSWLANNWINLTVFTLLLIFIPMLVVASKLSRKRNITRG